MHFTLYLLYNIVSCRIVLFPWYTCFGTTIRNKRESFFFEYMYLSKREGKDKRVHPPIRALFHNYSRLQLNIAELTTFRHILKLLGSAIKRLT